MWWIDPTLTGSKHHIRADQAVSQRPQTFRPGDGVFQRGARDSEVAFPE